MKKRNQSFIKKLAASMIATTILAVHTCNIYAESTVVLKKGIESFNGEVITWDDKYHAPTLRITFKGAEELQGKTEDFEIELKGAKWYEKRNTTLSFSEVEGIAMYDGYIEVDNDTKATVHIDIPSDITNDQEIMVEIPLLITIDDKVDEVSAKITELNTEKGVVQDTVVPVALSNSKKMFWTVGTAPNISDGGTMAPITFTESKMGTLGSREIDINFTIDTRDVYFKEPEYDSKETNSDDVTYYLDCNKYLEYQGGFTNENQQLKVTLHKDGKRLNVCMRGSVPSDRGIIVLKNIPLETKSNEPVDEQVMITVQGEDIFNSNGQVTVAHITSGKEEQPVVEEKTEEQVEAVEENEEVEETKPTEAEVQKKVIKFKIGEEFYTINDYKVEMQGKTFSKAPGYTMVPVRYVANALGVDQITVEGSKISFIYDGHEIIMNAGSDLVLVDQDVKKLEIPLEVVGGRVYAPIGSIANILNVQKQWDAQNQTACFLK